MLRKAFLLALAALAVSVPWTGAADGASAASRKKEVPAVKPGDIPVVKDPPVVILKFDDVKPVGGGRVHPRWQKVADYLETNGIHGSFGVICEGFESRKSDAARRWIAERRAKGCVSFWLHGWDHATWTDAVGEKRNEMGGRTAEDALARLRKCQELARREFGFAFTTYGPAGGVNGASIDAAALKALKEEKDLGIVLYPKPADADSAVYDGDAGLTVLDRVWAVNVEGKVGIPDYQRFLNGYARNLKRRYFVLQSHPAMWDDARFDEFVRIIEFLKSRGTKFMWPEEYCKSINNGK